MTYKSDKIRDLTPLVTSFTPGESPSAEKLQGMIRQADAAIEYLENKIGDLAGEEGFYNTWIATLARNMGSFADMNPIVSPNYEELEYEQNLVSGKVEHELDLVPVGPLNDLIAATLDSSVVISQWKSSVEELESPGDWTIVSSYIENGKTKRGRKLVTHAPSEGGSIIFKKATSGRGSSFEECSENTIPNFAQAENGGPFIEIELVDSFTKTYLVTLPQRTKTYDKTGSIIDFTASNSRSSVGLNSQYQLPSFFFGADGLDLETDDGDGFPKEIPLNLIKLYDWDLQKEVEGVISLKASATPSLRKYQFTLQTKQDVILNIATGKYLITVGGNPITKQIKALSDVVFGNTGDGNDMVRLISHKNMLGLRTGSSDISNRSSYYGPSNINNNDHSMYFHRNGFTNTDKGAGGNVIRGHVVVGSTTTGSDDAIHENYNVTSDSYSLTFGNILNGPSLKYGKTITHTIDHSYGGLPLGVVDCGLLLTGATSDLNPSRKNIFIDGDIRTSGNTILGGASSDVIFMQGKVYVNDELTLIPRSVVGITGEEGKLVYSSTQKALLVHNGSSWISPWDYTGYTTTIGDGVTSYGKYNGQSVTPFQSALADVASGGVIKVLPGTYNFLGNKITIPGNVTIEGSGERTVISGTGTVFESSGVNAGIKNLSIENATIAIKPNSDSFFIGNIKFSNCQSAIQPTALATNLKILENVSYLNCTKTLDYANTAIIPSFQTVMKSALTYSERTVNDWALKEEVLKEFLVSSGTAVVTYDSTLESSIGIGAFRVNGTGVIVSKKYMPVNPNVGVGGHINIKRLGASGNVYVGVICLDSSLNNLGTRYFIMDNVSLGVNSMEDSFYKGMMVGFSGYTGWLFPAGTKFVQPVINVTLNPSGIAFDSFEIINMTYARVGTWS